MERLVLLSLQLVQVRVPVGPGRYQTAYLTVTNEAVYLIERGAESVIS